MAGGIGGSVVGRAWNRRLDGRTVDKLFIALMAAIVAICAFNACKAFL